MCWTFYDLSDKSPQKLRAAKDIRVFKIAFVDEDNTVVPYYYSDTSLVYEEGKTYHSPLDEPIYQLLNKKDPSPYYIINHGLHSYNAEKCKSVIKKTIVVIDNTGNFLGSFNTVHILNGKLAIMDCSIPKGSAYYENEYGELVSDALRIDKMTIVDLNAETTTSNEKQICVGLHTIKHGHTK